MPKTETEPRTNCRTCRPFYRIRRALERMPRDTMEQKLRRAFAWARWCDWCGANRVYGCKACRLILERISGRQ